MYYTVILGLIMVVALVLVVIFWSVKHKPKGIMTEKQDKKWRDFINFISRWNTSQWMLAVAILLLFFGVVSLNSIGHQLREIDRSLREIDSSLSGIDHELDSIKFQLEYGR